jgi:hypothetical protein
VDHSLNDAVVVVDQVGPACPAADDAPPFVSVVAVAYLDSFGEKDAGFDRLVAVAQIGCEMVAVVAVDTFDQDAADVVVAFVDADAFADLAFHRREMVAAVADVVVAVNRRHLSPCVAELAV